MSECCIAPGTSHASSDKHHCPVNNLTYSSVPATTILHHVREPWSWPDKQQEYFYCDDPECDVVYFGKDDSIIQKSQLRTTVGIKEISDSALVCYCFGVNKLMAADQDIKAFVIKNTREHKCSCSTSNPSGRCCLKNFP